MGYVDAEGYNNTVSPPEITQGSPVAFNVNDTWDDSHLLVMAIRDTWDDYMLGNRTNSLFEATAAQGNPYSMPVGSNPVEPYWTHGDGNADAHQYYPEIPEEQLITYPQYPANADKIGFSRPYGWWEALWDTHVKGGSSPRDLDSQGWKGSGASAVAFSRDIDVEGENSALCRECLDGDGLIVSVFNHDLSGMSPDREDVRVHALNARTGQHVWDYHLPAQLAGDYFNATPAVANDRVLVPYQHHPRPKPPL